MFSRLYGSLMNVRNALYERGVFKSHSLGAKTVSIGNITIGGTGKTPLVALAAEILAASGEKVCILTRGYGRADPKKRVLVSDGEKIISDVAEAGDEPFELANKLLGKASVVADADRVAAARWAREKFGITAFVLDDAFQHRRARRDLDAVCVDATNPFGGGRTLPFGVLREPLENLRRADAIVITRANLVKDVADLKDQIKKYHPRCRIFVSENRISGFVKLADFLARSSNVSSPPERERLTSEKCLAFCALGNPDNFFEQLRQEKFNLAAAEKFPDHHFYKQKDIAELCVKAEQVDAKILLTTAKDAVKLVNLQFEVPCYVAESELVFEAADEFQRWLLS